MTAPVGVSFAPADGALATSPDWVRLDDRTLPYRVNGYEISRGRPDELSKTGAGSCTVDLTDFDGSLDTVNGSGPFAPSGLDPSHPLAIAIHNPVTDTPVTVFTGIVSDWAYDLQPNHGRVGLTGADLFDVFNDYSVFRAEITVGGYKPARADGTSTLSTDMNWVNGDLTFLGASLADRVAAILELVSASLTSSIDDSSGLFCTFTTYARDSSVMQMLMDACDIDDPGNLFMSKTGVVTFHGKTYRQGSAAGGTADWKVGTSDYSDADATIVPLKGLEFHRPRDRIWNIAQATWKDFPDFPFLARANDTSILAHGPRSIMFEDLITIVDAGADLSPMSDYWIENYGSARSVPTRLTFKVEDPDSFSGPAWWDFVTGVEIGDTVQLQSTHLMPGGFDERLFVEGLNYTVRPMRDRFDDVTLDVFVSPAQAYDEFPWP